MFFCVSLPACVSCFRERHHKRENRQEEKGWAERSKKDKTKIIVIIHKKITCFRKCLFILIGCVFSVSVRYLLKLFCGEPAYIVVYGCSVISKSGTPRLHYCSGRKISLLFRALKHHLEPCAACCHRRYFLHKNREGHSSGLLVGYTFLVQV